MEDLLLAGSRCDPASESPPPSSALTAKGPKQGFSGGARKGGGFHWQGHGVTLPVKGLHLSDTKSSPPETYGCPTERDVCPPQTYVCLTKGYVCLPQTYVCSTEICLSATDICLSDREMHLSDTDIRLSDRETCLAATGICLSDREICLSATDICLSDRERYICPPERYRSIILESSGGH